jgi:hypothetical protein
MHRKMSQKRDRLVLIAKMFIVGILWGFATLRPLDNLVYTSTSFGKVIACSDNGNLIVFAYCVAMGMFFVVESVTAFLVHGGIRGAKPTRLTHAILFGAGVLGYVITGVLFRGPIEAEHYRRLTVEDDMLICPPLTMIGVAIGSVCLVGLALRLCNERTSIEPPAGASGLPAAQP